MLKYHKPPIDLKHIHQLCRVCLLTATSTSGTGVVTRTPGGLMQILGFMSAGEDDPRTMNLLVDSKHAGSPCGVTLSASACMREGSQLVGGGCDIQIRIGSPLREDGRRRKEGKFFLRWCMSSGCVHCGWREVGWLALLLVVTEIEWCSARAAKKGGGREGELNCSSFAHVQRVVCFALGAGAGRDAAVTARH
ncbi:hypothetical protein BDQ17DRAFT_692088 [Cyathus striatus]|nr:hypothetical protein BDQ17DRAFT_692088 [Cyathus striatus]